MNKITKYILILSAISLISISFNTDRPAEGFNQARLPLPVDSLVAVIDIKEDMYSKQFGFMLGYHYEVLNLYGERQNVSLNILPNFNQEKHWDELINGEVDLLVTDLNVFDIPIEYLNKVSVSIPVRYQEVWVVRKDDEHILNNLNIWIAHFRESRSFNDLSRRYFALYDLPSTIKRSRKVSNLSPYDDIIKSYANMYGFDWRLVAAVVYKESKFSMGVKSGKDAKGLMQIKESTASYYGITDLYDPENNIKAGVLHLSRLKRKMESYGLEGDEVIKFTLAAYNAGEGRIMDCISFAKSEGVNHQHWSDVASVIPMMSIKENYAGDHIRFGKFRGKETIEYVDSIMTLYSEISKLVKG